MFCFQFYTSLALPAYYNIFHSTAEQRKKIIYDFQIPPKPYKTRKEYSASAFHFCNHGLK